MKTLVACLLCLLILVLVVPAYAWRGYGYGNHYYNSGISPGAAAGIGVGALAVGVLAGLLIGSNEAASRSQAELNMLDSAVRANQYENYLIGLKYFNAYTNRPVVPYTREQWVQWRMSKGLEYLP